VMQGVPFDSRLTPPNPPSWSNNGSGGVRVLRNGTVSVFTGERTAHTVHTEGSTESTSVVYRFSLMITPTR
jgi:hypothetical protein